MMRMGNPYIQYMYSYPHKTAYRTLKGVFLGDYAHRLAGKDHGLYLHIPFCQTKCGYCNLFSVTGQTEAAMDQYLDAIERQSQQYQALLMPYGTEFSEFTMGGGTPLLLTKRQLDRVFQIMNRCFVLQKDREIGIETAPNQTEREKLLLLKRAGVTRVSMGIQSFLDEELKTLGRSHYARQARHALELLRLVDFSCVNVDLIYGIPGQTVDSLLYSLKEALAFEPDEIFLYPLYVKHGAGLVREGVAPDWRYACEQYQEGVELLKASGFRQDSMRRFVRLQEKGKGGSKREFSECGFGSSLALGCGGRSYVGNLHFCTPYAITQETCLGQLQRFEETQDFSEISHGIFLSEEEGKRRYVIRHLLIRPGVGLKRYEESFKTRLLQDFPMLEQWVSQGFLYVEVDKGEEFLTLTDQGLGLSDYLGPMLASAHIREKMKEWERIYEPFRCAVSGKPEKL